MKILGLTGGSGAGKSTAAEILKNHNCRIIDCDKISKQVTLKGEPAYFEIAETFGKGVLTATGDLNRHALGDIVFNDRPSLKKLEEITHKAIFSQVIKDLEASKKQPYDLIVIDAPLLIESGLNKYADSVWLIYADYDCRLRRIAKRDNISLESAKSRLKSQTAYDELKKFANEVIDTTHLSLSEMEKTILKLKENLNG